MGVKGRGGERKGRDRYEWGLGRKGWRRKGDERNGVGEKGR